MFGRTEFLPYLCTRKNEHRGVEQLVARQAHNLEVARSSRTSATTNKGYVARHIPFLIIYIRNQHPLIAATIIR